LGASTKTIVDKLKNNMPSFEIIISQFCHDNPELVTYLKSAAITAAVAIVVGTIVEDFATAGVGIADDWASFLMAYRIVKFATKLP
jgi:hypothetical protein